MTSPSNANTSGLVAEIDAEMEGRRRGYADVRGELLFRCRDALVTAASAQDEREQYGRWLVAMANDRDAEKARADRYYEALVQADLTIRSFSSTDQSDVEFIRAALQQETQP